MTIGMPDATEDPYVIGVKGITLPQRTLRIPTETRENTFVTTKSRNTIQTFRAPKIYTNPSTMAKNVIGKIPQGAALAKVQAQLYAAGGFYDSNDVPGTGTRMPSDYAAMAKAMEAANARGVTWEDQVAFQINFQALAGVTPTTGADGAGAVTSGSLSITGPKTARGIFDSMYLKYTSKKSDDAEFSQFYDSLVKAQQATPSKSEKKKIGGKWYTVATSDSVKTDEYAETWVFNKINFADENIGGAAGQNLSAVSELAKMYDINLSLAERGQLAKDLTLGTGTDNDIRKTLTAKAKLKYPMLANDITETVTVRDLLAEQLAGYSRTLELNQADVNVSDIEKYAFKDGKLLNTSETIRNIKDNDIRYRSTGVAKQEASSFATGLARSLGFGAS
jgi:hypothetical protein